MYCSIGLLWCQPPPSRRFDPPSPPPSFRILEFSFLPSFDSGECEEDGESEDGKEVFAVEKEREVAVVDVDEAVTRRERVRESE